jgi:hypothetical protein
MTTCKEPMSASTAGQSFQAIGPVQDGYLLYSTTPLLASALSVPYIARNVGARVCCPTREEFTHAQPCRRL